jgi:hypothetical protein
MLLGGIVAGERHLAQISSTNPRRTISGYIEQRIASPYVNPKVGSRFVMNVNQSNAAETIHRVTCVAPFILSANVGDQRLGTLHLDFEGGN